MQIQGEFKVNKWDEETLNSFPPKTPIAKASIVYEVSGDINGKLNAEYLLHYSNFDKENPHNSKATYAGFMCFSGSINGKSGTFIIEEKGEFAENGPISQLTIKPNSGTNALQGISGTGSCSLKNDKMIIEFDLKQSN